MAATDSPSTSFAASYSYLSNGNIDSARYYNPLVTDASISNRYSYDYSYDGLNRLAGSNLTPWTLEWRADKFRNILYKLDGR